MEGEEELLSQQKIIQEMAQPLQKTLKSKLIHFNWTPGPRWPDLGRIGKKQMASKTWVIEEFNKGTTYKDVGRV